MKIWHRCIWHRCMSLVGMILVFLPGISFGMSVTFLNPGKSDEVYWVTASHCMSAAAHSLGVQLEILYSERDHLKTLTIAKEIAARGPGNRPDYVILSNDYAVGMEAMRILDAAKIKTFFAFSGISDPHERDTVAGPRQIYKGWLGSLEPKSEEAGYLTARELIQRGEAMHLYAPDGKLHMLVIAGDRTTTTSFKRNNGMRRAIAEAKNLVVDQEVYGEWSRTKAKVQSEWLYKRYPGKHLVWAGNDQMAFGAMESWRAIGGVPGKDSLFSGVNTSSEALTAIEDGSLTALAGGHFVAGAFALVMLYDYDHSKDFTDEGLELDRSMFILFDKESAHRFYHLFGGLNFEHVDFRQFSKVYNANVKKYEFSFRQILMQSEKQK
ncbi:ABC transporter substrate-binding protein [Undibacterium sp. SXout20W]|uniref:ABC transporter substrate-binding protein n=1 Tax=Undibacterium sp. SXout20W TaxID=3413051 RepID=UPI003BEF723C